MKRLIQISALLVIILSAVILVKKYRSLQAPAPVAAEPDHSTSPGADSSTLSSAEPKDDLGPVPATAALPPVVSAAVRPATAEEEIAPFREPRYAKILDTYARNLAAYKGLNFVPISATDRLEDVESTLRILINKQVENDSKIRELASRYDGAIRPLSRHLAVLLLRLSGIDAKTYLNLNAEERKNMLYVPEATNAYERECSILLPGTPIVHTENNQAGLHRIFEGLSALQLQGPSSANNRVVGWTNDVTRGMRLRVVEATGSGLDDASMALISDKAEIRHYFVGGIVSGSTIFTAPPFPKNDAKTLLMMFNLIIRTSDDFFTLRVISYYDPSINKWHLSEVARCVSPRVPAANPMVF